MKEGFKISYESDTSEEEKLSLAQGVESYLNERRKQLEQLAVKPEARLASLVDKFTQKYRKEWRELGGDEIPDIKIYFIPPSRRSDALAIVGGSEGSLGFHDRISRSVLVYLSENDYSEIKTARTLAHELAHAFGKNFLHFKQKDKTALERQAIAGGVRGILPKGDYGIFSEEYYAVERELEAMGDIENAFPLSARYRQEALKFLLENSIVTLEQLPYTLVEELNNKNIHYQIGSYIGIHKMGSRLMDAIPDGKEILMKARITGNWAQLAQAIDSHFGRLTFKAAMHVTLEQDSVDMFNRLLDTEDREERRKLAEEIISSHPSRKNK